MADIFPMQVKPGGWIQLGEQDLSKAVSGGKALDDTFTAIRAWMMTAGAGPGARFANDMAGWLKEEGFEDVQEVPVHVDLGPSSKDASWGDRSTKVLVAAATGVAGACKSTSDHHRLCFSLVFPADVLTFFYTCSDECRRP